MIKNIEDIKNYLIYINKILDKIKLNFFNENDKNIFIKQI